MIKDKLAKAVSRLWTGQCNVINYTDTEDENGNRAELLTIYHRKLNCSYQRI